MTYYIVRRTKYWNSSSAQLDLAQSSGVSPDHFKQDHNSDFQYFHVPLERMHNSNLHDWGIARGLEVKGTKGENQIFVNPGVAIDISGQLISLSSDGYGANDPEDPTNPNLKVQTPIPLRTESYAGKTVYVTIEFSEIRQKSSSLDVLEQVPWIRLQELTKYEKVPVSAVRYQAELSSASGNQAIVTLNVDAAQFRGGDLVSLVQGMTNERAKINTISGNEIKFETNLKNNYTGGTIKIADLIPQQKDIRLSDTTGIDKGTFINITQQNNISELRIVQSVDNKNNFITLNQGLVNTYIMDIDTPNVYIHVFDKSIVLAIAVIDNEGKLVELAGNPADLKTVDKLPKYHRRLIGESVEELRIQRSGNVEGTVQDIVSGKIGPGDEGGLKITVPDARDSVLFAREDGEDFKSLGINANVGIGTTTPSAKLNVDPQGRGGIVIGNPNTSAGGYTSLIMEISEEKNGHASLNCLKSSGSSGGDICLNPQGRNVGIGTINPSAKLEVNGDIKANASELETLVVKGKVGIGTTDPDCALHVNGTKIKLGSEKEGQLLIAGENNFLFLEANGSNDTGTVSELTICGNSIRNIPTLKLSADNTFFGGSITVPGIINSNQNLLVQGNVGIGTADPKDTLDVYGQIRLFGQNAFQGSDPFLRINPNNNFPSGTHFAYRASFYRGITTGDWWDVEPGKGNLLVQGNVGIGTINPSAKLDVQGATRINDNDIWLRGGIDNNHGIGWYGYGKPFAENTSIDGPVVFGYSGGALGTIKNGQNIALRWDVDGNICARGTLKSKCKDLAENYPSDVDLESGDVICLAQDKDSVVKSEKPNDPLVLGVVSTKPGFLLSDGGNAKEANLFPVALCGRVPCKVVDENGPIKRGDLLTSSSTPGHAMKASPIKGGEFFSPGTIIGKAIGTLEFGRGVIDIFVLSS